MEEWLERERNGALMEGKEKEKAKGAGLKRSSERDKWHCGPPPPLTLTKETWGVFVVKPPKVYKLSLLNNTTFYFGIEDLHLDSQIMLTY